MLFLLKNNIGICRIVSWQQRFTKLANVSNRMTGRKSLSISWQTLDIHLGAEMHQRIEVHWSSGNLYGKPELVKDLRISHSTSFFSLFYSGFGLLWRCSLWAVNDLVGKSLMVELIWLDFRQQVLTSFCSFPYNQRVLWALPGLKFPSMEKISWLVQLKCADFTLGVQRRVELIASSVLRGVGRGFIEGLTFVLNLAKWVAVYRLMVNKQVGLRGMFWAGSLILEKGYQLKTWFIKNCQWFHGTGD